MNIKNEGAPPLCEHQMVLTKTTLYYTSFKYFPLEVQQINMIHTWNFFRNEHSKFTKTILVGLHYMSKNSEALH